MAPPSALLVFQDHEITVASSNRVSASALALVLARACPEERNSNLALAMVSRLHEYANIRQKCSGTTTPLAAIAAIARNADLVQHPRESTSLSAAPRTERSTEDSFILLARVGASLPTVEMHETRSSDVRERGSVSGFVGSGTAVAAATTATTSRGSRSKKNCASASTFPSQTAARTSAAEEARSLSCRSLPPKRASTRAANSQFILASSNFDFGGAQDIVGRGERTLCSCATGQPVRDSQKFEAGGRPGRVGCAGSSPENFKNFRVGAQTRKLAVGRRFPKTSIRLSAAVSLFSLSPLSPFFAMSSPAAPPSRPSTPQRQVVLAGPGQDPARVSMRLREGSDGQVLTCEARVPGAPRRPRRPARSPREVVRGMPELFQSLSFPDDDNEQE